MRRCRFFFICLLSAPAFAAVGHGQPPATDLTDLHGDALPAGAVARLGTVRMRHDDHIGFAAFLPDSKSVISVGFDQTIRIWEFPSGKELRRIALATAKEPLPKGSQSAILDSVALSKDGKVIATCFSDLTDANVVAKGGKAAKANPAPKKKIRLHEVATGNELRALEGEADSINALAFSPDGQHLTAFDINGTVRIWDWVNAKQVRTMTRPGNRGNFVVDDDALIYSPDGKTLMYVESTCLKFIDVATGRDAAVNAGHTMPLVSVQFTPDGRHLLTHAGDGLTYKWDAATSKEMGAIQLPVLGLSLAAVSPDGRMVVGVPLAAQPGGGFPGAMPKTLAGDATVFDAVGGRELGKIPLDSFKGPQAQISMQFSPDGKKLAVTSLAQQRIELFDMPAGKLLHKFEAAPGQAKQEKAKGGFVGVPVGAFVGEFNSPVLFSGDSSKVAFWPGQGSNTVTIWDTGTGKRFGSLAITGGTQIGLGAFSPDGHCLAIDMSDGTVKLYELATGQARRTFGTKANAKDNPGVGGVGVPPGIVGGPGGFGGGGMMFTTTGQRQPGSRIAISPDGKSLVHAGYDRVARLWDILTGKELAAFKGHTGALSAIAFAPDGKKVASASADTTALLWDAAKIERPVLAAKALKQADLENRWQALADSDAAKGFAAIVDLTAAAADAVPWIEQHVKPATPVDAKRIAELIEQLDDKLYKVREKANSELIKIGEQIVPELDKALAKDPPLEVRTRLEDLRVKLAEPILKGDRLRLVRAVEVLEHIGTPQARLVLKALAKGAPGALVTVTAQGALKR